MTEQEQEHWDHEAGCASELQNCLAIARGDLARHNFHSSCAIKSNLSKGLFVVVENSTYHCCSTDAIAGVLKSFHSAHGTREEADLAAAKLVEDTQGDSDATVLPRLPDPVRELTTAWAARPVSDNDCPF